MFAVGSSGYVPDGTGAFPGLDFGSASAGPFTATPSRTNRKTYLSTGPEYDDQPPFPATSWSPCSERLGACVQYGSLPSAGAAATSAAATVAVRTARRVVMDSSSGWGYAF